MTTITDSGVNALSARFCQALASRLERHIDRLSWDAQRLAGHQREQLRALLAAALGRSPFHARRLAGIDPGRFELDELAELPVMSKEQMMTRTDHFIRHAAAGDPYLHATVDGRADEVFRYGRVAVDPLVIRTVMVRTPNAIEYQVRQTGNGIDVAVVAGGALDRIALTSSLEQSLRTAGLPDPSVHVQEVAEIGRHPETGKTRRFIAL